MEDLGTLVLILPIISPPRIGTCHGGLRDFSMSLPRKHLMEDFVQEIGVWRLIAVSPTDTVSSTHVCFFIVITKAVDLDLLKFIFKYIRK